MMQSNPKKRHRTINHRYFSSASASASNTTATTRLSSTAAIIDSLSDKTVTETSQKRRLDTSFNDPTTADVILHLVLDPTAPLADDSVSVFDDPSDDVQIYLHSHILTRAKYFSALLSDRWKNNNTTTTTTNNNFISLKLNVPPTQNSIENRLTVLQLLYTDEFTAVITSPSIALDILPVALELLFEECVKNCVKFLEAVPWCEEEENRVVNLIPTLNTEESEVLLARVRVSQDNKNNSNNDNALCEEMLYGLILYAMHNHPNTAYVKAFVAKVLRDVSNRESARIVLERAFEESLKVVKESMEEYTSPDFRGVDYNETEAIQRVNLHTALTNGKHLLWLVERMIDLKVADNAVIEWSEQSGFTGDLQRAFRDDASRNIVPGLPNVVLRCTAKLANAVASGSILAPRQVRMKLVKDWLPVLIVCKDNVPPMSVSHRSLYLELEETFLKIISTLPMSDAQELLQQCLSFSTRNVEDCPHLVNAFNTWFRRAMRPPQRNLF
ncbi:BTB/POZ domain-containing protein At1g63850 [Ricinus communis]|uniref:Protein binding protein, putative n=1 Tax=Ricinus communis TaxID=3988 RepID=B9RBE9_RICCO|nr:BTB/POZ domain-containing protein At1g63850 [Ricinus communis]EEF50870.1 protein binding protein, putative [Ricinus communis]|eukprot:XP_002509483.1 BTB/POZ domain-containing protein At1g63850 [Ricinus communis]